MAAQRQMELVGTTSVVLSTNEAPVEEIAVEDEPEADERDAAFWRAAGRE